MINFLSIINLKNFKLIILNNIITNNVYATYGGWFHMYSFFITLGIICSIFASFIRLKIKKISTETFIWSIFFIIPFSLFGASFFGKFNSNVNNPWILEQNDIPFFSLFAFWKAGMSIHGGVLFGTIIGLIIFGIIGQKTKVSLLVYTDSIIPNILLGQSIGRWGNFFNHELLGSVTTYDSLYWLPAFIRNNSWQWDGLYPETKFGEIIFRQPIFLYESFFNLLAWIFIVFFIPVIGQLFSKKPWKKDKIKYPFDLKYSFINFFNKKYVKLDKMTWKEVWNKAFFNYIPNIKKINEMLRTNIEEKNIVKEKKFFINFINKLFYNKNSLKLTKLNNPENYLITRCGVQTGFYFFLWNLIRFVLETQRDNNEILFIKNNRLLDYIVLILITLFGLLFSIYTQLISIKKFRKNNFLYEKEYINFYNLETWKFKKYLNNNIIIGEDNYIDKLSVIIKIKTMEFLEYKNEIFEKYFKLKYIKIRNKKLINNEIINYNFKIIALKTKNNKFFNELIVNQNFKFDLSKILRKVTLKLIKPKDNNFLILIKKEIILLLNNNINTYKKITKIKKYWNNFFPNINEQKTMIFNINFNNLIYFDKLKININNKKIKLSKFEFKENEFYYFSKKIFIKLK